MMDIFWFIGAFILGLAVGIGFMALIVLPSVVVQVAAEAEVGASGYGEATA